MKTQIFITVWVVTLAVAVFFGLSSITINQTQHQKQIQSQVQAQHNAQITIVDTSKRYTNVYWEISNFHDREKVGEFINTELDFSQQKDVKFGYNRNSYQIIYPVYNKKSKVYTNSQESYNTNHNQISVDFLKGWR